MPASSATPPRRRSSIARRCASDPKNNELLDRAFISSLADGDIDEAVKLADRILTIDKSNRVARLVVGVRDLKHKEICQRAAQHQPVGPRADHRPGRDPAVGLGQLRRRRHQSGRRQHRQADRARNGTRSFKDLHSGMILELAGQGKGRRRPAGAGLQARQFHAAGGRRLCALAVPQQGRAAAATAIYEAFDKKLPRHPLVLEGLRETKAGKKLPPLVNSPQSRRRRGALRHRRNADAPRRRRPRAGLSAARALPRAAAIRWRCCRLPISTSR